MSLKDYAKLSKEPQRGVQRKPTPTVDLSKRCPYLPNWKTNKEGRCKRVFCEYRGKPKCPARGYA